MMCADLRPQHSTHLHASLPRHSLLVLATALVATLTFDDPKFFLHIWVMTTAGQRLKIKSYHGQRLGLTRIITQSVCFRSSIEGSSAVVSFYNIFFLSTRSTLSLTEVSL